MSPNEIVMMRVLREKLLSSSPATTRYCHFRTSRGNLPGHVRSRLLLLFYLSHHYQKWQQECSSRRSVPPPMLVTGQCIILVMCQWKKCKLEFFKFFLLLFCLRKFLYTCHIYVWFIKCNLSHLVVIISITCFICT